MNGVTVAVLGFDGETDGGVRVLLDAGPRPVTGRLAPEAVGAARATVRRALAPQAGLLLEDEDPEWVAREVEASRALVVLLAGAPEVGLAFARARGPEGAPWLCVDAGPLGDLPWELLGLAPGSAWTGCPVARWVDAPDRPTPTGPLCLVRHAPVPEDPVCADALERVDALARRLGIPARATGATGGRRVLHVVTHGVAGPGGVGVEDADGARRSGAALRESLAGDLDGAMLVVLDVCGAGSGPAAALAASGVPVVAPTVAVDSDAVEALHAGLYAALQAGAGWPEAVQAGRERVRALGRPHASARWWGLAVFAGRLPAAPVPRRQALGPAAGLALLASGAVALGAVALGAARAPSPPAVLTVSGVEDTPVVLPLPPDVAVTAPLGVVERDGTGWRYVPPPDHAGAVRLEVGGGAVSAVALWLAPVDDEPRLEVADLSLGVGEAAALTVRGEDPEGQPLTWTSSAPTLGRLEGDGPGWTYVAGDVPGQEVLRVVARDGAHAIGRPIVVRVTGAPPAPRAAPPHAPGRLEVRPRRAAAVSVGEEQGTASRVMPWAVSLPAGPHTVRVVDAADGRALDCAVLLRAGDTARLCPDVGAGGCTCP